MDRGFIVPVPSTEVEVWGSRDHGRLKHDRETSAGDRSSNPLAIDPILDRTGTKRRALELVSVGETKRGARI